MIVARSFYSTAFKSSCQHHLANLKCVWQDDYGKIIIQQLLNHLANMILPNLKAFCTMIVARSFYSTAFKSSCQHDLAKP